MTNIELENIKQVSIRGRYAYVLVCFEDLVYLLDLVSEQMKHLLNQFWAVVSTKMIGALEDMLIEYSPDVILEDYENFKRGVISMADIGLTSIQAGDEFTERYTFLKSLPPPMPFLIHRLRDIATRELCAGLGQYSHNTYVETIEAIEVIDTVPGYNRPSLEIVNFSKFNEDHGWGRPFSRTNIIG